jgi:hypothetical protein
MLRAFGEPSVASSETPSNVAASAATPRPLAAVDAKAAGVPRTAEPSYFEDALRDAERLLTYAAETGVDVADEVRDEVLRARAEGGATAEDTARLLVAFTKLAAQLKPVSAESLKACGADRHAVHSYWKWAVGLAVIIVPFSIASFVTATVSEAIRKDIGVANELAVKLTSQLQPAPPAASNPVPPTTGASAAAGLPPGLPFVDVATELQQFAAIIRAVDRRARQLNFFVLRSEPDPFAKIRPDQQALHDKFEVKMPLTDLMAVANERITVYQDVRYFAQRTMDDVSFFYGAISTCLLPVLYALLGTCAYLLRSFEQDMKARTFIPSTANSARFLIAGIGGGVVGLFNNMTITQSASIPPLGIAFLVGYAVDVFFSFLEGLLNVFTKTKGGSEAR